MCCPLPVRPVLPSSENEPLSQVRRKPVVLIVRDGWGENPYPEWNHANAVHLAKTPVADALMRDYPHVLIHTSGEEVGLPAGVTRLLLGVYLLRVIRLVRISVRTD